MTGGGPDAGLPRAARNRMVRMQGSGTWGSTLSTDEFAAVCGAGFEPVGQVFGACVYNVGEVHVDTRVATHANVGKSNKTTDVDKRYSLTDLLNLPGAERHTMDRAEYVLGLARRALGNYEEHEQDHNGDYWTGSLSTALKLIVRELDAGDR